MCWKRRRIKIEVMKGKAFRKHSLRGEIAASVLLKLISGNKKQTCKQYFIDTSIFQWKLKLLLIRYFLRKHKTAIGTTRPMPPNRRSRLGCIRWKDMSNPKRLRWNIVLAETFESRSAITNQSEHLEQRAIGTTRPIPLNRLSCKV